jgi:DNA-binding PadR family transcriptional regulator
MMTEKHVPFATWLFENEHHLALIATPKRPIPTREELEVGLVDPPAMTREDWQADLDRLVSEGLLEATGQHEGPPYRLTRKGREIEAGLHASIARFVEDGFIEPTDEPDGQGGYRLTEKGKAAVRSDWQQAFDRLAEDGLIEVTGEQNGQPVYALTEAGREGLLST